jgi:5'-nucleotidase
VGSTTVATKQLSGGRVVVTLPRAVRTATVTAQYAGSTSYLPARAHRTLTVR